MSRHGLEVCCLPVPPETRDQLSDIPFLVPSIQSTLTGLSGTTLVVRLPLQLVDETVGMVRDEVVHRLPNADGAALILDCAEVELINSIGITCLLQVQDHSKRLRAPMVLAAVPESIAVFLTQLKLIKRFPSLASVDEAVASFDRV